MESHEKSWNLGKAILQAWKVMEKNKGHGIVMENDAVVNGLFTTALSISTSDTNEL